MILQKVYTKNSIATEKSKKKDHTKTANAKASGKAITIMANPKAKDHIVPVAMAPTGIAKIQCLRIGINYAITRKFLC